MIEFTDLPQSLKNIFHGRASRLEGTNGEALYSLIPEQLKDNVNEIVAFLQGHEELGVEERDVSHFVSSHNGGSDHISNLGLERESVNASLKEANFTPERMKQMHTDNAVDAETIDLHFTEDAASDGLTSSIGGIAEVVGPMLGGVMVGRRVYEAFDGDHDEKLGMGVVAGCASTIAFLAFPPLGTCVAVGLGAHSLYKLAQSRKQSTQTT